MITGADSKMKNHRGFDVLIIAANNGHEDVRAMVNCPAPPCSEQMQAWKKMMAGSGSSSIRMGPKIETKSGTKNKEKVKKKKVKKKKKKKKKKGKKTNRGKGKGRVPPIECIQGLGKDPSDQEIQKCLGDIQLVDEDYNDLRL